MKTSYLILTILFWIAVLFAAWVIVMKSSHKMPSSASYVAGHFIGTVLVAAVIPVIIFLIRYFVGKELKKRSI